MTESSQRLGGAELRKLKSAAQRLEPVLKIGKNGLTDAVIASLETTFANRELLKVKFSEFKEEKKALAAQIAERTGSRLVQMVGHVAVFYRKKPDADEKE